MGELDALREENAGLHRAIGLLHEISVLVRSAQELAPTCYALLTGVTAGVGLGMHRAAIFLGEPGGPLVGMAGVGPSDEAEADRVWREIAAERPVARVWCTDASADALDVARANCAGLGRPARRVTMAEGPWFDALPAAMVRAFDVVVSNPPYIARDDDLPAEVAGWEPSVALLADGSGLADLEVLVDGAGAWLAPGGALVLEMAPDQTTAMADRARTVGYVDVGVHRDLTGRDRALVARLPA